MKQLTPTQNFTAVCKARKEQPNVEELLAILTEEYDDPSSENNTSGFRSHLRSRRLALALIDDKGELDLKKVGRAAALLREHLHIPLFSRLEDSLAQKHLLAALEALNGSPSLQKLLKQIGRPESLFTVEEVIRATLDLPPGAMVGDREARRAVLAAWFCYLRQSVGSCFATAPALLVQSQMPEQFLRDLKELFETGRLKRVSSGREYYVPFSGGLKSSADTNALLKAWEYTIASFAETKADFSKWNLYASLGLDPEEPGGIGFALWREIKQKLEMSQRKVHEYQAEYETLYTQLKYAESRARSAASEKELSWLRAEAQSRYNEFQTFETMRNREHQRSERLSRLFSEMIDFYLEQFPLFFQEVYDADLQASTETFWDDRPAGFRLLFKHGRLNTSLWTKIDSPNEFSTALASFFTMTEPELTHAPSYESLERDLTEIVTLVIQHVKTEEFQETALWRMSKKHGGALLKKPLENLDKVSKKPWAYTSGGSLETLVASYFKLEERPRESSRFVESEMELLVFLADTLKLLPGREQDLFLKEPERRMLMHSPTHAFNLKPGLKKFYEIWQNGDYTYTWVRDEVVYPMQRYWEGYEMHEERYRYFISRLRKRVDKTYSSHLEQLFEIFPGTMSPSDLSDYIVQKIDLDGKGLFYGLSKGEIDSALLESLPLLSREESKALLLKLSKKIGGFQKEWLDEVELCPTAPELIEALMGVYMRRRKETSFGIDWMEILINEARALRALPPEPLVFADSNWSNFFFTFLVNPGSGRLELWRTDRLGLLGSPMSDWKQWLDGSRKEPKWGLLTHMREYSLVD